MFGLLDWLKVGAGAALGALVASGPAYLYGAHAGRQQAAVAALEAVTQAYKDRTDENEAVEALNPGALCVELGGMPDDCAAELRRLAEDHGQTHDGGLPGGQ
ncbi:hypothetical protein [Ollibium composti]|uniref:Uncharacterized protein n=1 Tax=Ollibium composti TaxID=2675109 RepID=A0ABY2Q3Z6_9HYPH|nr:hypothetical protein [Mesorhizobium composti]THF54755.1 hypothetical protein E6C48_21000 [Mesorhizobium composti]